MFRLRMNMMILALLLTLFLVGCNGPTQLETESVAGLEGGTAGTTAVMPALPTSTTGSAFDCTAVSEIPAAECQALAAFYQATQGANWVDRTGWLQTTTPCSWYGVTCEDGHLDTLALYFNNLQGQLPAALSDLPRLRVLDLNNNAIAGEIPPEIGRLTNLIQLDLSVNQLSGSLPAAIGDLAALQWLMLPYNQLSGPIPPELGKLQALHTLDLSHNQLSGTIPESLADGTALATIRLRNNQLSGRIPFGLGQLPALYEVDLSFNQLTGSAPSSLFQVGTHRLWGNQLDGTVFVGENGRRDVNFLGATLTFDQATGDSVWPELVPARPAEPGPGMMWAPSEHIVFTFAHSSSPQERAPLGQYLPPEGQIHIYPTAGLNEEAQPIVAALQELLVNQREAVLYEEALTNGGAEQLGLTMLPPSNAAQTLRAQVQYLSFTEGTGIRYLTQLSQGPVPISNQDLFYTFQGLTSDGATYVAAYFPVTLPALPDSPQLSQTELETLMADWPGYLARTLALLNEQPTAAFTPDLAALDAVINSLSVAGTTAVPTLQTIWPSNEESVASHPILQWETFPGAVRYQVVVVDTAAYPPIVVLDETTTETSLAITPALKAGSYTWTVWAFDGSDKLVAELNSSFTVASSP